MKISGIYKIQSAVRPERTYIGSAVNISHRWSVHLSDLRKNNHHSLKLQRHFIKYGETDLCFSILLLCERNDLLKIEQYFLDAHKPYFNNCLTARSALGIKRSKETKQKQSLLKLGKSLSEEHCKAIVEGKKKHPHWNKGNKGYKAGRIVSEKTRGKISEANLRNGNIPPSQKGNKRSDEWKSKRKNTFFIKKNKNIA